MTKTPIKYYDDQRTGKQRTQWYRESPNDAHNAIFSAVGTIDQTNNIRALNNAKYLTLYENQDIQLPGLMSPQRESFGSKLTFNVIRSVIDTAASKIAASKPRPEFKTDDGDYRLQRQALALTQFNDSLFYQNQTYALMQDCFVDAALWGTGVIQVYQAGSQVKHERVRIDEILIDDYEGQYRNPKNFFHRRPIFRDELLARAEQEQWDEQAIQAIKDAPQADVVNDSTADMVHIVEAWHLARLDSEGKPQDGKHAVALQNRTLSFDEYKSTKSPFAFYRWSPRRINFYGAGLAEELVPIQYEIGMVLKHIARHNRHTGLKIFVEPGSQVNPAHLGSSNIPVIESIGVPTAMTFPGVSQETYAYLENLFQKAYNIPGIAMAQANGSRPAGITANAALETLSDQQTERFMLNSQRFEQFACDIADLSLRFCIDIASDESDTNPFADSALSKAIRWKKLDLDSNEIKIKCFPVSAFTQTPAARLQKIQDWLQAGSLAPRRALQIMGDNPDYRDWVTSETASLTRVQMYLDRMKHDGEYNAPDAIMDLSEAIQLAQAEVNRSIVIDVPEHNVSLMRQFISDCHDLLTAAQAPPAPDAMAASAPPLAQPEQAPTSALLPISGAA